MGWFFADHVEHEGYLVALEPAGVHWTEVRSPDERVRRISVVQAGCVCGWRSHRMHAPFGTEWLPCCVDLPEGAAAEEIERRAIELWREHVDAFVRSSDAVVG